MMFDVLLAVLSIYIVGALMTHVCTSSDLDSPSRDEVASCVFWPVALAIILPGLLLRAVRRAWRAGVGGDA